MTDIRIRTDDEYNPFGDCEPYDRCSDDKITHAINKDVDAIDQTLETFSRANEDIGYANGSIDELLSERARSRNPDDREAFSSQIENMKTSLSIAKDNKTKAELKVRKAFEHYYS